MGQQKRPKVGSARVVGLVAESTRRAGLKLGELVPMTAGGTSLLVGAASDARRAAKSLGSGAETSRLARGERELSSSRPTV